MAVWKRGKWAGLLVLLGLALMAGFTFGVRPAWLAQNDVTTGATPAYPELRSRVYPHASPDVVFAAAVEAARRLPRWRVTSTDPVQREAAIEVRTALFWFTDDLTVRVEPEETSGSRVVIRSRSRVGRGDLGENARHIAALQRAMDRRLSPPPAH